MVVTVDVGRRDWHKVVHRRLELTLEYNLLNLTEVVDIFSVDVQALHLHVEVLLSEQPTAHIPEVLVLKIELVHALVAPNGGR